MPETPENANAAGNTKSVPDGATIHVLNQYIKDLSFENPGNTTPDKPGIDLEIDVGAAPHRDQAGVYEVVLKTKARVGTRETILFLLEMDYIGLFQVADMPPARLQSILLVECPHILFPFARRIIADISAEGGFPALRIDPVDFSALYEKQARRSKETVVSL